MHSPRLRRRAPSLVEQYGVLEASVVEAVERSFLSFADRAPGAPPRDDRPWVVASVAFRGACAGALEMIAPEAVCHDLFCALAGEEHGDRLARQQVFDAFGELANIVCGDWLTRVCRRRRFDLRPPDIRLLDEHDRDCWWSEAAAASLLEMRINDEPLRLRLRLQAEVR
jgi:chemotaxis phosphatase CheX-like protein